MGFCAQKQPLQAGPAKVVELIAPSSLPLATSQLVLALRLSSNFDSATASQGATAWSPPQASYSPAALPPDLSREGELNVTDRAGDFWGCRCWERCCTAAASWEVLYDYRT